MVRRRRTIVVGGMAPTMLGNIQPCGLFVEGVLVGVEALQCILVTRVVAVHGSVVLVAEDDA
jgi:hypothetical protein